MKKRDIWLIGLLLAAALMLYLGAQTLGADKVSTVVVTIDGEEVLRKPLAVHDSSAIRQDDGSVNGITGEHGAVYLANCRDGLCIQQGRMRSAAKTIVCLPHRLVVTLSGEPIRQEDEDLDVIIS